MLLGQADDQPLHLVLQRRPACLAMRIGPGTGDQSTVPPQEGLRLDQEAGPAGPVQHAADGGERGPIGRRKLGSWELAVQTASWWRSTRISRSLAALPRASIASSWMERQSAR
jgi:hypothetical protein